MLTGLPGVGKTLTAEVFAEIQKKPLYAVQSSQLGVEPAEIEKQLNLCFERSNRWNAVLLIDEADVYVHQRTNDLKQNSVVGTFLRVHGARELSGSKRTQPGLLSSRGDLGRR